jgi:hydrophobic/amphiphilic exporter-1 (mainly G- bacteria), HAE1 family
VLDIGGRSSKSQYQFTLTSSDLEALYQASAALDQRMQEIPGLTGVTSDLQIRNPQVQVAIARDRASALGIDVNQIESALYNAYGARQVSTIYTPNDQYWVVMELLPEYQRDLSALNLLHVTGRQGVSVPLGSLAKVTPGTGPLTVNHSGQLPSVTLSFDLEAGTSLGTAVQRVEAAAREVLPSTISTSFAGTAQAFQEAQAGLAILLVMAVLVIYLVLGILYESFIHPLTILSGLPFAGFGALLALAVFGLDLSIYAYVGIIMLVGIVKKNAIMMIDFAIEAERNHGKSAREAILEAARVRFPADHDDHDGRAHGHAADRAGARGRRGSPAAARDRGRGRTRLLPDRHALHHAGDLHLLRRAPGAARPAESEGAGQRTGGRVGGRADARRRRGDGARAGGVRKLRAPRRTASLKALPVR